MAQLDSVAATDPVCGGGPLPNAVQRQDRRFVERRRKERARGVRLVVLGKDDLLPVAPVEPLGDFAR